MSNNELKETYGEFEKNRPAFLKKYAVAILIAIGLLFGFGWIVYKMFNK